MTQLAKKHPRGFNLLFFTELWERFGFYTVQTIITLYMTEGLLFSDHKSYILYGAFSAMLYITPAIGGYLADRYTGFQWSILFGGILFTISYLITALPGEACFFWGLSVLIVANGFLKPNVSSIVGELYEKDDPRRDGGFTLFYMGINIGSLIPPLIAGPIVAHYGWHAGFLVAAIGMMIGLSTFILGRKKFLGNHGLYPSHQRSSTVSHPSFRLYGIILIGTLFVIGLVRLLFQFPEQTNIVLISASVLIMLVVLTLIFQETPAQRNKMLASLVLILISVGFWALYNQTFTSLMIFAEKNMNKHFLGFTIDAEFTQFFNPFAIIVFSPLLSRLWIKLEACRLNPSIPTKFALGVLFMSLGFFAIAAGSRYFGQNGSTSSWWLASSYFIQTIGELLISPIGLSMITVLSSKKRVGMMMGVWFLSQAAASAISGNLATVADIPTQATAAQSLQIFAHAFYLYGTIALVLSVMSFLLIPWLRRLIREQHA